jgi:hypothetical protein
MTHVTVSSSGVPCPRCGRATEIREHRYVTAKELRRPFYFCRWFYCRNPRCKTTTIVLPEHRVHNAATLEMERRMTAATKRSPVLASGHSLKRGIIPPLHE